MSDFKSYEGVPRKVEARQVTDDSEQIVTRDGATTAARNSWIVRDADGMPSVMDNDSFQESFGENKWESVGDKEKRLSSDKEDKED